ncbi:hypothetical protein [Streptacidiphilus sp. PAMC 29251]
MPKQLTVHNATVATAAFEVKTFTVSGKQVTLAVFRQLKEESVLDSEEARVLGSPWGVVNYHPDKCADNPEHIHVVWQKGDELRRSNIGAPETAYWRIRLAGLYAEKCIADGAVSMFGRDRADDLKVYGRPNTSEDGFARFRHGGMTFSGTVRRRYVNSFRSSCSDEERAPLVTEMREILGTDSTPRAILDRLPVTQYRESWAEMSALPQLFIAV